MIQLIRLTFISGFLFFLSACSDIQEKSEVLILDQSIETQASLFETGLAKERPPIQFENGKTAYNCNIYLQLQAENDVSAITSERIIQAQYQDCSALALLNTSHAAGNHIDSSYDKQALFAMELCRKLDLQSFEHSLRPRMTETMRTAEEALGRAPDHTDKDCIFTRQDRHFELKPVIHFQDSKTSEQYLIVWFNDEILSGSYRDYQSLLVKITPNGLWKVIKPSPTKA